MTQALSLFQQDDPLQRQLDSHHQDIDVSCQVLITSSSQEHTTKCLMASLLALTDSTEDLLVTPKEYADRLAMQEEVIKNLQAMVADLRKSNAKKDEEIACAILERDQAYNERNKTLFDADRFCQKTSEEYKITQNHNVFLSKLVVKDQEKIGRLTKALLTFGVHVSPSSSRRD